MQFKGDAILLTAFVRYWTLLHTGTWCSVQNLLWIHAGTQSSPQFARWYMLAYKWDLLRLLKYSKVHNALSTVYDTRYSKGCLQTVNLDTQRGVHSAWYLIYIWTNDQRRIQSNPRNQGYISYTGNLSPPFYDGVTTHLQSPTQSWYHSRALAFGEREKG